MIQIDNEPWRQMVEHARATYPNECCGAMIGSIDDSGKVGQDRPAAGQCLARLAGRPL